MKQLRPAIGLTLFFLLFTGLLFPLAITGLAQAVFPHQANGSMVKRDGKVVGSELIGQPFVGAGYFHPRPSAAGSGYDANNSSGTNLGPTNPKLTQGLQDDPATPDADESYAGVPQLAEAYRKENGLAADIELPADAVTRSSSGLDPHISPRNAELQVARIARARGIAESTIQEIVRRSTDLPFLGIFGEPAVNVLRANLALDDLAQGEARR